MRSRIVRSCFVRDSVQVGNGRGIQIEEAA